MLLWQDSWLWHPSTSNGRQRNKITNEGAWSFSKTCSLTIFRIRWVRVVNWRIHSVGPGPVWYPSWKTQNFESWQQLFSFFPVCQTNPNPKCVFYFSLLQHVVSGRMSPVKSLCINFNKLSISNKNRMFWGGPKGSAASPVLTCYQPRTRLGTHSLLGYWAVISSQKCSAQSTKLWTLIYPSDNPVQPCWAGLCPVLLLGSCRASLGENL